MNYQENFSNKGQSSNGQRPLLQISILVVDDDSTTLTVVSSMLLMWSYKDITSKYNDKVTIDYVDTFSVEIAKNPLDALATLRMQKGMFDIVVTDLHMPFMNGFELKRLIDKEFRLPVIMMSADDQENTVLRSLHNGIALHITKPVKPDDLKDVWQFAITSQNGKSFVLGTQQILRNHDHYTNKTLDIDDNDTQIRGQQNVHDQYSYSHRNNVENKRGPNKNKKIPNRLGVNQQERKRKRKSKVVWTNSLHNRFLLSIRHLGYDKTVPKRILEFMNVPGLTRENVASHLQKYRLFLRKVAENGITDATKILADRFMRSSFAAGYPIQLMIQHAQQMYPHLFRKSQQRLLNSNRSSSNSTKTVPVGLSTLLIDNHNHNHNQPSNIVTRSFTTNNNTNFSTVRPNEDVNGGFGFGIGIGIGADTAALPPQQHLIFRHNVIGQHSGGRVSDSMSSSTDQFGGFGYVGNNAFEQINQTNNQIQNLSLRVEDYTSDLSDITYENPPNLFNSAMFSSVQSSEQSFGQVNFRDDERAFRQYSGVLEFPSVVCFPQQIDQFSLQSQNVQSQSNKQVVQSSGVFAFSSDESYFGMNQIPLQNDPGNEQTLYNTLGNNELQSDGYYPTMCLDQNATSLQLHGNDQQVMSHNPSSGINNPPQGSDNAEFADSFQQVDVENFPCEVDWDEFMDCMLNEKEAPDLRD